MQCPLSRRPVDLRGLRVEQVLGTFLRNYFPAAYRAARDEIAVIGHTEAAKASPRPPPPRVSPLQTATESSSIVSWGRRCL